MKKYAILLTILLSIHNQILTSNSKDFSSEDQEILDRTSVFIYKNSQISPMVKNLWAHPLKVGLLAGGVTAGIMAICGAGQANSAKQAVREFNWSCLKFGALVAPIVSIISYRQETPKTIDKYFNHIEERYKHFSDPNTKGDFDTLIPEAQELCQLQATTEYLSRNAMLSWKKYPSIFTIKDCFTQQQQVRISALIERDLIKRDIEKERL